MYDWPGVRVLHLPETDRVKRLSAMRCFFDGEQHDHKKYDFTGRPRVTGNTYLVERLKPLSFEPVNKPALGARKPDTAIPLQRQVVQSFDQMIYPRGQAPTIEVPADPRTERYLRAVMKRSLSWVSLQAARSDAGKTGEAAIRVGVIDGKPITETIDTRELHVREWADQMEHVPAVVVWQRQVEVQSETADGLETVCVWRTRVYDETHEYEYEDVAEDYGEKTDATKTRDDGETAETGWIPIAKGPDGQPKIVEHKAGRCPILWVQNTRCTTDPAGDPDCDGVYHLTDEIDVTASMIARSTRSNLDPTLHVKDELRWHRMNRVYQKGWGGLIRTSDKGDAKLLESSGSTVEMGWKTYRELRKEVMYTTSCVIIDPENAGKYAQSGKAHSMLWRPMEAASGRKRVPQELVIEQMIEVWATLGGALGVASTEEEGEGIKLPPVKLAKAVAQEQGYQVLAEIAGEGEEQDVLAVHQVGTGRHAELIWPPYHETSPEQYQATVQATAVATGGAKLLSQRTGTRLVLRSTGMPDDVDTELARIEAETERNMDRMATALNGSGGGGEEYEEQDDDDESEDDEEEADESESEDDDGDE